MTSPTVRALSPTPIFWYGMFFHYRLYGLFVSLYPQWTPKRQWLDIDVMVASNRKFTVCLSYVSHCTQVRHLHIIHAGSAANEQHMCAVVELMAMNGRQGSPLVTIITATANAWLSYSGSSIVSGEASVIDSLNDDSLTRRHRQTVVYRRNEKWAQKASILRWQL